MAITAEKGPVRLGFDEDLGFEADEGVAGRAGVVGLKESKRDMLEPRRSEAVEEA